MASDRINYGIDLGTTNSAIVRMERGQPVVIKNDLQSLVLIRGAVHRVSVPCPIRA